MIQAHRGSVRFSDMRYVDNVAFVGTHKRVIRKYLLHLGQLVGQQMRMRPLLHVYSNEVTIRLHVEYVSVTQPNGFATAPQKKMVALVKRDRLRSLLFSLYLFQRLQKAFVGNRLEQIVGDVEIVSVDGVLVMGRVDDKLGCCF